MHYTSSVTQKGQITLPKVVRDALGIKTNNKVVMIKEKDYIKVIPTSDILDIAGKYKQKDTKDPLKAREDLEETYERF